MCDTFKYRWCKCLTWWNMSPSLTCFLVFQSLVVCFIKSLKKGETNFCICVTRPLSSSRTVSTSLLSLKHQEESESPSRLCSQPVESRLEDEELKPDTCIRSNGELDVSSTPKLSRMSSSTQQDESDSLSWVQKESESCSRPQSVSKSPLSSVLDVSSVSADLYWSSDGDTASSPLTQTHTSAQVQLL